MELVHAAGTWMAGQHCRWTGLKTELGRQMRTMRFWLLLIHTITADKTRLSMNVGSIFRELSKISGVSCTALFCDMLQQC